MDAQRALTAAIRKVLELSEQAKTNTKLKEAVVAMEKASDLSQSTAQTIATQALLSAARKVSYICVCFALMCSALRVLRTNLFSHHLKAIEAIDKTVAAPTASAQDILTNTKSISEITGQVENQIFAFVCHLAML